MPGRIDTHQHIVPPRYRSWLLDKGLTAGGRAIPEWTAESALELMGENNIDTAILSVSTPGVEPAVDIAAGRSLARELNEFTASVVQDHRGRFGFFATLTLPDVGGALDEAAYALDELGADGIVLLANSKGTYLGDEAFDPLFDELDRRHAVVFVHPSHLPIEPVPGLPPYAADFLLDTTRAALNLAKNGCMDRYPNLKIILSHAGGFLPYAAQRAANVASPMGTDEDGLRILRKFYFDIALSGSPYTLPSLMAFADPTRITFGSDWPFAPAARSAAFTRSFDAYGDLDHGAIDRDNAETLFPRLALTN
ncbi:amidohydrolase family protein [Nocardia pseudovaccinii]|uniref:amidohydrolase family protein n=1 Tax=Nocardia pseudovaccinii TaxID=189540 RepID=UPI0007A4AFC3|nr:amidohydrolase family protein [Nocardia pseudovaccinii]